jgi:hypothetical protein
LDRDWAVAACVPHEFLDAPIYLVSNPIRYGERSEQVVLGHAEAALDAP